VRLSRNPPAWLFDYYRRYGLKRKPAAIGVAGTATEVNLGSASGEKVGNRPLMGRHRRHGSP